jgi:hypothetical protein
MELVTVENLEDCLRRYSEARGGELNEMTDSEAAFVLVAPYWGCIHFEYR